MRWNARLLALGIVLLSGSAASFAAAQAAPPPVVAQRLGQATDPLTLFAHLTPVLTSPRCLNCHGGTDPVNGTNHGGGAVGPDAVCRDCHTASAEWQGVSGIQFDTDVMPLCQTMRHVVQVIGPSSFVNFLASDPVVGLGFNGLRGMDDNSPFWPLEAEPPPLSRAEFVAAAQQWVTEGNAQCGSGWNGSVSLIQTSTSVSPGYDAGETTVVDIKLVNGQASAHIVDNKHETSDSPAVRGGCASFRHNTGSASGDVAAAVNVNLADDEYQIVLNIPAVTGTWTIDTLNVGGCNAGRVSRAEPYAASATYTIPGTLDPNDPTHVKGTRTDTGASVIKTTVTWDLTLEDN